MTPAGGSGLAGGPHSSTGARINTYEQRRSSVLRTDDLRRLRGDGCGMLRSFHLTAALVSLTAACAALTILARVDNRLPVSWQLGAGA